MTNVFLQETSNKAWESVVHSYNHKLDQAKEKAERGKKEGDQGSLAGYIEKVREHTGKFFTPEQAEILIRWA